MINSHMSARTWNTVNWCDGKFTYSSKHRLPEIFEFDSSMMQIFKNLMDQESCVAYALWKQIGVVINKNIY